MSMSGSREVMRLFAVNPSDGAIRVKSDLSADTQLSYTVSVTNVLHIYISVTYIYIYIYIYIYKCVCIYIYIYIF